MSSDSFTRSDLDKSLIRGIAWTGGMSGAVQLISWIASLVIARLLSPADYGIATLAWTVVGFGQLLSDLGLTATIVHQRELNQQRLARLGGLAIASGAFFWLSSLLLAGPIAAFFREADLETVIRVVGVTLFISGIQVLPRSILSREYKFRELASVDAAEASTMVLVTFALALGGYGFWSLILGGLAARIVGMAAVLSLCSHKIKMPLPIREVLSPLTFSANISGGRIAWYIYIKADIFIVGWLLGTAAAGTYSIAWSVASIPVERIAALVTRATPTILASVRTDAPALKRYVLGLTEGVAIVTFPCAVGLALVSDLFVAVAFGAKWEAVTAPLRVLCLASVCRSITPILNQALVATGQARQSMQASVANLIVLPMLFTYASQWGLRGVALAWLIGYPIISGLFLVRYALRACDITHIRYLSSLKPALVGSAVMSLAVLGSDTLVPALPNWLALLVKVSIGIVAYCSMILLAYRPRVSAFIAMLRSSRNT